MKKSLPSRERELKPYTSIICDADDLSLPSRERELKPEICLVHSWYS